MTNINDILGYPCRHYNRYTYDYCRECNGRDYHCTNYIPFNTQGKKLSIAKVSSTSFIPSPETPDQIIRKIKGKNYEGCI